MDSMKLNKSIAEQLFSANSNIEEDSLDVKCEKIRAVLKSNPFINDQEFINNMVFLSREFYSRFPGANIDTYYKKLKDLSFSYFGKFYSPEPVKYLPSSNQIIVNKDRIMNENIDAKHGLMKALIAMITTKGTSYGFGSNHDLEALNVGFCEMIARVLVGLDGESGYKQEREIVDLIGKRIGVEPFIEAFFTNNPDVLTQALLEKCQSPEKLKSILGQINNNMVTKKEDDDLIPANLELQLIQTFGNVNLEVMKQPITYSGHENIKAK